MHMPYNKSITASILANLDSEEKVKAAVEESKNTPEKITKLAAFMRGINEEQYPIYKALMEGNLEPFIDLVNEAGEGYWFESGDVLLMCGDSLKSELLVKSQKPFYSGVRSSHVAVFFVDHILVDAMPGTDVSPRTLLDVLKDAKDNWRIIRKKGVARRAKQENLMKACIFYIAQEYEIFKYREAKKKKSKSYCSELARKIFQHARVENTGIAPTGLITPAHFDRLADESDEWEDVTDNLRPAIEFVNRYEPIFNILFEQTRNGLLLNRDRFKERADYEKLIKKKLKKKLISKETAAKAIQEIVKMNSEMNNQFWDHQRMKKSS
ncbi:hypothetical protein [Alteromonas sp. KUL106]|uniref:hypothetical protein n=1 Tax=Alteromonas sp. KUL106 TaxID=2480799 RepID=UPI0012E50F9A|nr:hypothetical protein [Alteromonas sp. KUL106]GFD68969.1 hypothetical protein KUL106_22320 [Alteromonas sp. KUL106]